MIKKYVTIETAYDVSGGNANFKTLQFQGKEFLAVQLFYSNLNQADHKLRLQESLNGIDFVDSKDQSENIVEIIIDNSIPSDILKVNIFNTVHYRFQFIEGTSGTGTIDKLFIVNE